MLIQAEAIGRRGETKNHRKKRRMIKGIFSSNSFENPSDKPDTKRKDGHRICYP
jgi:hypothetical protein